MGSAIWIFILICTCECNATSDCASVYLSFLNQKADDLESWYAASGARVCSNDDPELTLTYFTARSNLVPYAFVWEKVEKIDFSETIVVYDLKLATDDRNDKKCLLISRLCPLGAECPLPRGYIHVLNHENNV